MPLEFRLRPTLVAYLTCGDPDLDTTRAAALAAIDAGAGIIELGVPFSDPVADGPVIQHASERALRSGTTLHDVLSLAWELRKSRPQSGLIIFSYFNPVFRYGIERFCTVAQENGIDGALVTDLTVEEAGDYVTAMRARNRATVFLAAPTSTDVRLRRIARASSGFVYAVSRSGVTGTAQQFSPQIKMEETRALVKRIRRHTKLPIAVGFGISDPQQFAAAGEFADGVVVGSAIVKAIENAGRQSAAQAVGELVSRLIASTLPLKAARNT
ncbi:MAG: tryptophan synthase subunit alpha [Acidobacteriales bacterium]|nr:tryptophan synthase subunit alpha [Terriglobales bacterium]